MQITQNRRRWGKASNQSPPISKATGRAQAQPESESTLVVRNPSWADFFLHSSACFGLPNSLPPHKPISSHLPINDPIPHGWYFRRRPPSTPPGWVPANLEGLLAAGCVPSCHSCSSPWMHSPMRGPPFSPSSRPRISVLDSSLSSEAIILHLL